jgi:hypothetical protein
MLFINNGMQAFPQRTPPNKSLKLTRRQRFEKD